MVEAIREMTTMNSNEREEVKDFADWLSREDYGDSEQLSRCWSRAVDLAATAMREKCVEKVKVMRDEWQKYEEHAREDPLRNHLFAKFQAAKEVVTALESLTLEAAANSVPSQGEGGGQ